MDTAKVQRTEINREKSAGLFAYLKAKANSMRLFNLQGLLILPYVVLTLILASIGLFIVTRLVVDSEHERFYNNLVDSSKIANDGIVRQERLQLEKLRPVAFAEELPDALKARNVEQITQTTMPFLVSNQFDLITAIDMEMHEIITYGKYPDKTDYYRSERADFSSYSAVQKVIKGDVDNQGDKYAQIITTEQGPALFTVAPVRDDNDEIVGALMVGYYVKRILTEIKSQVGDVVLFDPQGQLISTTVDDQREGYSTLVETGTQIQKDQPFQTFDVTLDQREYQLGYSPLAIRGENFGWIGVLRDSQYLVSETATSRNLFIGLFTVGTMAVILIGFFLAQNIARPILKLRSLTKAVAAGDYDQQSGLRRSDEIGDLAEAFDTMTGDLRARTDEAARAHAETLQRNRELAEINARLEATQQQLIQSEKLAAIGQLTAGIVHDVKNPFAVIMGMSEVLADDDKMDESTKHGLKVIRESAVKGNTIVSDLLKFARQSKPEMRYADLGETVKTAQRLTAYLTRKYTQVIDLPENPVMVTYDAQQIEQVLINLIHNAVQAMPNNGSLHVSLNVLDDCARIAIGDTGCGIPPENLKRIFDPFFTTKPEGEGTGLGLSVSYGIIMNHHGKIDVESEVGKGTTFFITLPIEQPISSS